MPSQTPEQIRDKLRDYLGEVQALLAQGATREQILNGANGKHGVNHVNELFMMLPDTANAEFRIKE